MCTHACTQDVFISIYCSVLYKGHGCYFEGKPLKSHSPSIKRSYYQLHTSVLRSRVTDSGLTAGKALRHLLELERNTVAFIRRAPASKMAQRAKASLATWVCSLRPTWWQLRANPVSCPLSCTRAPGHIQSLPVPLATTHPCPRGTQTPAHTF